MIKPQQTKYTLAELTKGLDIVLKGDPSCVIKGVCTIQHARSGCVTFLMNPLYKKYLATTKAAAVILSEADAVDCPVNAIISRDPYFTYAKIASFFEKKPIFSKGVHPSVVIGEHCKIDPSVIIAPNTVIGNKVTLGPRVVIGPGCVIGESSQIEEDTRLDANVTLYHEVIIGKRVLIASGVVIGSDGFGLAKHQGSWQKVPQLGGVIIEDDVEIGANCSIDRGAIDNTVIEKGAKLDDIIQIGHNGRIGENTAVAGCVGIAAAL